MLLFTRRLTLKEENIVTKKLSVAVQFDGLQVKFIKFDLEHINRGWDSLNRDYNLIKRSTYSAQDIVEFFEQFKYYNIEWEEGKNKNRVIVRGEMRIRYFAYVYDHNIKKQKKLVVDIPEYFKNEGIIVTLY